MSDTDRALSAPTLEAFQRDFRTHPEYRHSLNAVTRNELQEVALNRRVLQGLDWTFSHEVPVGGITAQRDAGTCWLFAGLNWLRKTTMQKLGVSAFEYSQNHLVYWDKLEKANRFLEQVLDYRDRPLHDRYVHTLLSSPINDGGNWSLLADLIGKYGLMPKAAMADTVVLGKLELANHVLLAKLRQGAATLRGMHARGARLPALRKAKRELLQVVHRILTIMFGEPPEAFDFGYRDAKGKHHRLRGMTPHRFRDEWVAIDPSDTCVLTHAPLEDTPFYRTLKSEFPSNIEGGAEGLSLNVPMEVLRELARKQLERKQAVLFSCDVTHAKHRKLGVMDPELYDFAGIFDTDLAMDRRSRQEYHHQSSTHAMVMVGMDLVDGRPLRWKVENSWSEEAGEKGLFQMTDAWFEEYVHSVVLPRKVLPAKLRKLLELPPIVLPPWHPVG